MNVRLIRDGTIDGQQWVQRIAIWTAEAGDIDGDIDVDTYNPWQTRTLIDQLAIQSIKRLIPLIEQR